MIPKRIFYIWFGGAPLPQQVVENLKTWRQLNPDYEIIEINEHNYDVTKNSFVAAAYRAKKWAFASDVARLEVLYQHGGFYFDTDVKMLKPLEPLREYKSVWAMEMPGYVGSGLIIGAASGDNNIERLLKMYSKVTFNPFKLNELVTTKLISQYFWNQGLQERDRLQTLNDGTVIFPSVYFAPIHWWGGGRIKKRSIAVQQYHNSWGQANPVQGYDRFKLNLQYYSPKLFHLGQVLAGMVRQRS